MRTNLGGGHGADELNEAEPDGRRVHEPRAAQQQVRELARPRLRDLTTTRPSGIQREE